MFALTGKQDTVDVRIIRIVPTFRSVQRSKTSLDKLFTGFTPDSVGGTAADHGHRLRRSLPFISRTISVGVDSSILKFLFLLGCYNLLCLVFSSSADLKQRWEPTVSEQFPSTIGFWVRIHGIPLHLCSDKTVETIGNQLGNRRGQDATDAKVRVELNGLQPLEMTMDIQLPTDEVIEVEFEYIKIEKHCFTCFSLFHEESDCPQRPRNAPPPKDRRLGITQRIALQRIEAEKNRHDERRGYRRPEVSRQDTRRVVDSHARRSSRDDREM
ncbi:unnamed protein product, partial [Brassica oleracea]